METPEYSTWNNWGVFNSKPDKGEDRCRDSDNRSIEINQIEAQRKKDIRYTKEPRTHTEHNKNL